MKYSKYTRLFSVVGLFAMSATFAEADTPATSGPSPAAAAPSATSVFPTTTTAPAPAASFSAPFQYANGKIMVQAKINGMGPYSIALDSGAETMMISQQVADACKLSVQTGTVEISGTSGGYVPVSQAQIDTMTIGGATVNKPFCTISPRPISVDGYMGAPLFNAYTVQIDFGSHQITCYPPDSYKQDPADQMVPIPFGKHRVPVVQGAIGGVSAKFEVDTGSTFPAEVVPNFVKTNDLSHKFTKIGSVMTNSVAGPSAADVYGAPTLSVGNPAFALGTNVPTLFMNSAAGDWDGRIGAAALSNSVVTFDYAHGRLYIRPAQTAPASTPLAEQAAPPVSASTPTAPAGSSPPVGTSATPPGK